MSFIPTVLLVAGSLATPNQDKQDNSLFQELTKQGLEIGAKAKAIFPAPTMDDGLDAAGQTKVVQKLIQGNYDLEDFVRNSVVAPNLLRIRDIEGSNQQAPGRGIDFWFVAHGDWAKIADRSFIERSWNSAANESKSRVLTAAELAKRKIMLSAEQPNQAFAYGAFTMFSKVEISAASHSSWSKTPTSFIVAGRIDPRFDKDAEFPNRWRSMKKEDDGKIIYGPAQDYHAAGYYLKLTRMHEPAGAIFIEGHIIFSEPMGWFDGANFLRSKLPLALQTQVRALRREFLKTTLGDGQIKSDVTDVLALTKR